MPVGKALSTRPGPQAGMGDGQLLLLVLAPARQKQVSGLGASVRDLRLSSKNRILKPSGHLGKRGVEPAAAPEVSSSALLTG